jgi:hypothetical protein
VPSMGMPVASMGGTLGGVSGLVGVLVPVQSAAVQLPLSRALTFIPRLFGSRYTGGCPCSGEDGGVPALVLLPPLLGVLVANRHRSSCLPAGVLVGGGFLESGADGVLVLVSGFVGVTVPLVCWCAGALSVGLIGGPRVTVTRRLVSCGSPSSRRCPTSTAVGS